MNNKYDSIEKEKQSILSDRYFLKDKLYLINEHLKTSKDVSAMDYVMTLELIRKIITYYKDDSKNIPNSYYDLVLSEIEPTLDDLTIESLMTVIAQYQDIDILRYKQLNFSEHNNLKKILIKDIMNFKRL